MDPATHQTLYRQASRIYRDEAPWLFLFFGKYILSGLHISEPALNISGGVILFLIAPRYPDSILC